MNVRCTQAGEKFNLALAYTLSPDGAVDEGYFDSSGAPSLADKYEYVMYGEWHSPYTQQTSERHG
jgi:hypothetical protein